MSRELSASQREHGSGGGSSSSSATFRKSRKEKERDRKGKGEGGGEEKSREERVVIIDIDEHGTGVKSVASLSPAWQVLSASISSAPTFEQDLGVEEGGERGLMLRIEGVGVKALEFGEEEGGEGIGSVAEDETELAGLVEGFERKMGVLRRVLEGGGRKEKEREGFGGEEVGAEGEKEEGDRRESEDREIGAG